ncbi:MAG: NAD(P)H-dependent oxidoreductase [Crocinitomicaceae bacterium]|nr:NAD(P)H-dependent oxidoreductase [Flavobacteriales bacterium]NQZ38121.1 NAD(P)H-dependent oxidoreductase [Crocinitomicaceae bacterium]
MKRILAFGASTSSTSINKQFAHYAAHQIKDAELILVDLNDFAAPLYSMDIEISDGIPDSVKRFKECIESMDGLIISLAEHNGNFAAAFKSLTDWASRLEGKIWSDKKMFLLSTSPGGRGGKSVHELASAAFPRQGATITASFSLPSFNENLTSEGITDPELAKSFAEQIELFSASL